MLDHTAITTAAARAHHLHGTEGRWHPIATDGRGTIIYQLDADDSATTYPHSLRVEIHTGQPVTSELVIRNAAAQVIVRELVQL